MMPPSSSNILGDVRYSSQTGSSHTQPSHTQLLHNSNPSHAPNPLYQHQEQQHIQGPDVKQLNQGMSHMGIHVPQQNQHLQHTAIQVAQAMQSQNHLQPHYTPVLTGSSSFNAQYPPSQYDYHTAHSPYGSYVGMDLNPGVSVNVNGVYGTGQGLGAVGIQPGHMNAVGAAVQGLLNPAANGLISAHQAVQPLHVSSQMNAVNPTIMIQNVVPSIAGLALGNVSQSATQKEQYLDYLLSTAHQHYNASDFTSAYNILSELISHLPIQITSVMEPPAIPPVSAANTPSTHVLPQTIPALLLMGCTCYSLAMYPLSIAYNTTILTLNPSFAEAYSNLGTTCRALGGAANLRRAEQYYRTALTLRPNYWDAGVNLAGLLSGGQRFNEALDVYIGLERVFNERWETNLNDLEHVTLENDTLLAKKLIECEKLRRHQQHNNHQDNMKTDALSADRRRDLYFGKGNLYFAMGDIPHSKIEYFKSLVSVGLDLERVLSSISITAIPAASVTPQIAGTVLATKQNAGDPVHHLTVASVLQSLAKIYQDHNQNSLAVAMYYTSLSAMPTANTCNNLGILLAPHRLNESISWYEFGLSLDPSHVHLYTNLGSALKDRGQVQEGIQCYQRAIALQPDFYIALANLANVYKDLSKVEDAIDLYRRALRVRPDFIEAFCNYVNTLLFICQWDERTSHLQRIRDIVESQIQDNSVRPKLVPTVLPFHTFTYSSLSAHQVREISRRNASRVTWNATSATWFPGFPTRPLKLLSKPSAQITSAELQRSLQYPYPYPLPSPPSPHIKIGYVSSDFNNHPLAHLMQSVFGMHNRKRFKVYAYALSGSDGSPYRSKIEAESDVFVDISNWNTQQIIECIVKDGIHILVNLNGYTKGGRNEIFACRPTPITMTFMGFAGTMGAGRADDDDCIEAQGGDQNAIQELEDSCGWLGVLKDEDQLVGNRTQEEWESTQFFDEMSTRWMDYFVSDEIATPRKFVCGEPLSDSESSGDEGDEEDVGLVESSVPSSSSIQDSTNPDFPRTPAGKKRRKKKRYLCRGPVSRHSDRNRVYTENLVYLPHSYFVNDHRQGFRDLEDKQIDDLVESAPYMSSNMSPMLSPRDPRSPLVGPRDRETRRGSFTSEEEVDSEDELSESDRKRWRNEQIRRLKMRQELFPGIKEDTIIFANFNQLYKIDPHIFNTWLNIITRVPNSILWLLRFPPAGEQHLRNYALKHAGDDVARRIIFTDVAPKHVHIHRGRIADIFLDTPECNAHTTAADILWSGTPVITFPKYDFKMCSRVAASIAFSTGSWSGSERVECIYGGPIPDDLCDRVKNDRSLLGHWMIVGSYKEYEERAVLLASQVTWHWKPIGSWRTSPREQTVKTENVGNGNRYEPSSVALTTSNFGMLEQILPMSSLSGPAMSVGTASQNPFVSTVFFNPYTITQPVQQPYAPYPFTFSNQPVLATQPYFSTVQLQQLRPPMNTGHAPPTVFNNNTSSLPKRNVTSPFYSSTHQMFQSPHNPYATLQDTTHIFTPQSRSILIRLRRRLFLTRDSMPLFDTELWVRNVEKGMELVWQRWEEEWAVTRARNEREVIRVAEIVDKGLLNAVKAKQTEANVERSNRRRTTSKCLWIPDENALGVIKEEQ